MGLMGSRQYQRWTRGILRVILNIAIAAIIAFAIHTLLLRATTKSHVGDDLGLQIPSHGTVEPLSDTQNSDGNATLWEVMLQDPSLQRFVNFNMPFLPAIKGRLDNLDQTWTVYAPINSAFEGPQRHPVDAPIFYYIFTSMNHIGSSNVSYEELKASTTVENLMSHDMYFRNMQRISTKSRNGEMVLNHVANYVGRPLQAINGFVHHIDSLLYLPDAVSNLLRSDPDLQTFQAALIDTDVAVLINDTQSHLTQTVFAPTNEAFQKLGAKVNKFLFSPLGKAYLTALLQYHVVMNSTMFTDVHCRPKDNDRVKMDTSSEAVQLPTLLPHRNLTASIVNRNNRQTILLNYETVPSHPDLIVMDGVVHKIDSVLLPPSSAQLKSNQDFQENGPSVGDHLAWFWPWSRQHMDIGVMELMDRLQPYLPDQD